MQENLLIIDTSTRMAGVAVFSANELITLQSNAEQSHSEETGDLVKQALIAAQVQSGDIDKILINAGPGSFTGLRIGYALACGLSTAWSVPIVQLPGLMAMAASLESQQELVVVLRPAGRTDFFCGWYKTTAHTISELCSPGICNAALIESQTQELSDYFKIDQPCYVVDHGSTDHSSVDLGSADWSGRQTISATVAQSLKGLLKLYQNDNSANGQLLNQFLVKMPGQLHELQPMYMRAVAAKTIVERMNEKYS